MYFHKIHDPINCSFPVRYDDGSAQRISLRDARERLTGEPLSVRVSRVLTIG